MTESRWTPMDADYASCDYTHAQLLIYSKTPDIEAITSMLGINPSDSQSTGDVIVNSRGSQRRAKSTYWCLSSEGKIKSKDLRHHLDWLLGRLVEKEGVIKDLQDRCGISMSVLCIWGSLTGHGGPTLWPEQMDILARLNLECAFDIHFL